MNEAMEMDDEDELDEEAEKVIQGIEFGAGGGGGMLDLKDPSQTMTTNDMENDLKELK